MNASKNNTYIINSYKIKNRSDMRKVLSKIRSEVLIDGDMAIHHRSISSMVNEWRVHNILYSLNIFRSEVMSVDLNINQSWYIKALYAIVSPFYFHFS